MSEDTRDLTLDYLYMVIHNAMTEAREGGYDIEEVYKYAKDAAGLWLSEMQTEKFDQNSLEW